MDEQKIKQYRQVISAIMAVLAKRNPLIYAAISTADIYVTDNANLPARASPTSIYVYSGLFDEAMTTGDYSKLITILAHEAIHILLMHGPRGRKIGEVYGETGLILAWLLADAKVDYYLRQTIGKGNETLGGLSLERIAKAVMLDPKEIVKEPLEILVEKLMKNPKAVESALKFALTTNIKYLLNRCGGAPEKARRLSEGSGGFHDTDRGVKPYHEFVDQQEEEKLRKNSARIWRGDEKTAQKVREALAKGDVARAAEELAKAVKARSSAAKMMHSDEKSVGNTPGVFERVVEELSKGKYDWRKLLSHTLLSLARETRRTWVRLNKKLPEMRPAKILEFGVDRIISAIDVSGSISDQELKEMADAIYDAVAQLRPRKTVLVFWDYGVRSVRKVSGRPSAVKNAFKKGTPGGGGTSIREALELAARESKPGDVVIIASDWMVEEKKNEVKELLRKVRARNTKIALIATPKHDVNILRSIMGYADITIRLPEKDPFKRAGA